MWLLFREGSSEAFWFRNVVEELALIASAWQFWLIALAAIPRGYSTGRCWQTGRTRNQTVVLLLGAGRHLLGQVFVIPGGVEWCCTVSVSR